MGKLLNLMKINHWVIKELSLFFYGLIVNNEYFERFSKP